VCLIIPGLCTLLSIFALGQTQATGERRSATTDQSGAFAIAFYRSKHTNDGT
jgi:hypothetical protein